MQKAVVPPVIVAFGLLLSILVHVQPTTVTPEIAKDKTINHGLHGNVSKLEHLEQRAAVLEDLQLADQLESIGEQFSRFRNENSELGRQISEIKTRVGDMLQNRTTLDPISDYRTELVQLEGRVAQIETAQSQQADFIGQILDQNSNMSSALHSKSANLQNQLKEMVKTRIRPIWITSLPLNQQPGSPNTEASAENTTRVHTSEELALALRTAAKGSVIELAEGLFTGPFLLSQDSVVLKGQGNRSVIKLENCGLSRQITRATLNIPGKNSEIQDIRFISNCTNLNGTGVLITGSGNHLTSTQFEGFTQAIKVWGDENKFTKTLIKRSEVGFYIIGDGNVLSQIKLMDMTLNVKKDGAFPLDFGVSFRGDNNSVHSLECEKCHSGVVVRGSHNLIHEMEMKDTVDPTKNFGIVILRGSGNTVDCFTGDQVGLKSKHDQLLNVTCSKLFLGGSGNILVNVDAGSMEIRGSGHRLEQSRAKRLDNQGTNVTFEDFVAPTTSGPTCAYQEFTCSSGECIKLPWKCDGEKDCPDGDDEWDCPT